MNHSQICNHSKDDHNFRGALVTYILIYLPLNPMKVKVYTLLDPPPTSVIVKFVFTQINFEF